MSTLTKEIDTAVLETMVEKINSKLSAKGSIYTIKIEFNDGFIDLYNYWYDYNLRHRDGNRILYKESSLTIHAYLLGFLTALDF